MKIPPKDLLSAAQAVLPHAYAPYSHFQVAASLRTEKGAIFASCNVENAAFSMTLCAEACAIGAMFAQGHQRIVEALVLVSDHRICSPCGSCRQRFLELSDPKAVVHLCTENGLYETITVAELLPLSFGPENLGK